MVMEDEAWLTRLSMIGPPRWDQPTRLNDSASPRRPYRTGDGQDAALGIARSAPESAIGSRISLSGLMPIRGTVRQTLVPRTKSTTPHAEKAVPRPAASTGDPKACSQDVPPDDILIAAGLLNLGDDPPADSVENALRELGRLAEGADEVRLETLRARTVPIIKALGWRAAAVDAVLGPSMSTDVAPRAGTRISLDDPEPWPRPVAGRDLMSAMVATFVRYLGLLPWAPVVLALWVLHTHAHDAAEVSPLLAIPSPEKRCGKTTLLHLLGALVPRPLPASNVTAAALFRAVEQFRPTLLVDEADTFLRDRDELRGVLNSGHARASAIVVRTAGDAHEARVFSTWAPKAVAMIGTLPDTLADRSLVVPMRRRRPDEHVERLRLDQLSDLEPLRRQSSRWAADHLDALRTAEPDVPPELHDRGADNWRPLLAIADLIGGDWPDRARRAARVMAGADDGDDGSVRTLLLRDLRDLFRENGTGRLSSRDVVEALRTMEERPWPEWGRSRNPMTANAVARQLKPFGVRPRQLWIDGEKTRGYEVTDLSEAFDRYLSENGGGQAVDPVVTKEHEEDPPARTRYEHDLRPSTASVDKPLQHLILPGLPPGLGDAAHGLEPDLDDWDDYEAVEREAIQAEAYLDGRDAR